MLPCGYGDNFVSYLLTFYVTCQVFSDGERSCLLSDALNLARAGQLRYQTALDVTGYLRVRETDLLPWDTVVRTFNYITQQLHDDPDFSLWQASRDSTNQSVNQLTTALKSRDAKTIQ